jgi:hypothetical protein
VAENDSREQSACCRFSSEPQDVDPLEMRYKRVGIAGGDHQFLDRHHLSRVRSRSPGLRKLIRDHRHISNLSAR